MLHSLRLPAVVAALALLLAAAISAIDAPGADAVAPANSDFQRTWARTDQPVAAAEIARTWIWGPEANTGEVEEQYAESPGGMRVVQYFDKSRMEINDPNGDRNDPFFVTNGLLVVELMTGRMQKGDNVFEAHNPAAIPVAGDPDDTTGPTYAALGGLRASPPAEDGETIIQTVDRDGFIDEDEDLASHGITAAYHVQVPGINHQVASVFWEFMNSSGLVSVDGAYVTEQLFLNPFYATGYPITEAYFAQVKVAGVLRTVLIQCFERRCMTWTPGNFPGFESEAGNVGLHYRLWRYILIPGEGDPTPTSTGEPGATATATSSVTETATTTETPTETATATSTAEPGVEYAFETEWGGQVDEDTALSFPMGVGTDSDGNVYVLDSDNSRVVKYDSNGAWITSWGVLGDEEGQFDFPTGIFVGFSGTSEVVLVADTQNHRIQQFSLNGTFQREWGEFGDGDAQFDEPNAVTASGSDIYVADTDNNRVHRFLRANPSTSEEIWGELGDGDGEFNAPVALAVDNGLFVYVVDSNNGRVQVFNPSGHYEGEFGNSGPEDERLELPVGIAIDSSQYIYVVDQSLGVVTVWIKQGFDFDLQGTIGEVGEGPGQFSQPNGIAVDSQGFIYVTDIFTNSVLKFSPYDDGDGGEFIGSWSGGERGAFDMAAGIAVDEDQRVFVTDIGTHLVQIFDTEGNYLDNFGGFGDDEGFFDQPSDAAIGPLGVIYIADTGNGRVQKISGVLLSHLEDIGSPGDGEDELGAPVAVAVDGDTIYVADQDNARVKVYDDDGDFINEWGSEGDDADFDNITGIAIFDGIIYVVEQGADRIQMFEDNGDYIDSFGETGIGEGQFGRAARVAVSLAGLVFVTDESRNVVLIFTADGEFLAEFGEDGDGEGEFDTPLGIALDEDGNIYVVDSGNYRVQKFVPVVEE